MTRSEAKAIIEANEKPIGLRVSYERRENGLLYSEFFPDHTEKPIPTLEEARELATQFASRCGDRYCNIYVMDNRFCPVDEVVHKSLWESKSKAQKVTR